MAEEENRQREKIIEEDFEEEKITKQTELVPTEKYLKTGAHIGTKMKTGYMRRYIYKQRKDGLKVLDVETVDKRIKAAANFLSQFPPEKIVLVSRKLYGHMPIKKFAELTGAIALAGRFTPGAFTNPEGKRFFEPMVIVVTESDSDRQAVKEATAVRIPVIALASTNNTAKDVDIVVPINNKGRKSLALALWILAREYLKSRGQMTNEKEFENRLPEFEQQIEEGMRQRKQPEMQNGQRRMRGPRRNQRRDE